MDLLLCGQGDERKENVAAAASTMTLEDFSGETTSIFTKGRSGNTQPLGRSTKLKIPTLIEKQKVYQKLI